MKVLHLLHELKPSGMERMLVAGAQNLIDASVETLVIGQGTNHPFRGALEQAGFRVELIPSVRSLKGFQAFRNILEEFSPEVTHIHAESAFLSSVLASKISAPQSAIIRTIHSHFRPTGRARLSRSVQSYMADRMVSRFVAPSSDVAENERLYRRDCRVVVNWIEERYLQHTKTIAESDIAVIVGNCSAIKNHELAIRAVANSGLKLAHFGSEDSASDEELNLLSALELEGRIVHRGAADPLDGLKLAGVFLMPSRHEGMSVALAEALALKVPAIVADSPGLRWSKGLQDVSHVGLQQDVWDLALSRPNGWRVQATRPTPDFSPARGIAEYMSIYIEAVEEATSRKAQ